ncbi:UNVERIFIED_CONTAM: hypothetical protein O8I53_06340 [Campylobacter lari]
MMKFKKNIVPLVIAPIVTISAVSCNQSNENLNKLDLVDKNEYKFDKFNNFIKQDSINSVLNLIYKNNNEELKKFIQKQITISHKNTNNFNLYLRYSNTISGPITRNNNSTAKIYEISDKKLDRFNSKN